MTGIDVAVDWKLGRGGENDAKFRLWKPKTDVGDVMGGRDAKQKVRTLVCAEEVTRDPRGLGLRLR